MRAIRWCAAVLGLAALALATSCRTTNTMTSVLYQQDWQGLAVGAALPDDVLVLGGSFSIVAEGATHLLALGPEQLDDFGLLVGPDVAGGVEIEAAIRADGQKRLVPRFGVGLNGVGGYRLLVTPAAAAVQLLKGDDVVASAPFAWTPNGWLRVRLRAQAAERGGLRLSGWVWPADGAAPAAPLLLHADATPPPAGRPALYGAPYAGKPIFFGPVSVRAAPGVAL